MAAFLVFSRNLFIFCVCVVLGDNYTINTTNSVVHLRCRFVALLFAIPFWLMGLVPTVYLVFVNVGCSSACDNLPLRACAHYDQFLVLAHLDRFAWRHFYHNIIRITNVRWKNIITTICSKGDANPPNHQGQHRLLTS